MKSEADPPICTDYTDFDLDSGVEYSGYCLVMLAQRLGLKINLCNL